MTETNEHCKNEKRIILLEQMQNAQGCDLAKLVLSFESLNRKIYVSNGEMCINEKMRRVEDKMHLIDEFNEVIQWVRSQKKQDEKYNKTELFDWAKEQKEMEEATKRRISDSTWKIIDNVLRMATIAGIGTLFMCAKGGL